MATQADLTIAYSDLFRNSYNLGYHPAVLLGDVPNLDGQRALVQTPLDYLAYTAPQSVENVNMGVNSINTQNIQDLAVTDAKISSLTADKITAGTIGADVIYAGTISADRITAGTLQSGVIYAGNISANQITTGTLTVGGSGATAILINHTAGFANAILKWASGSSLWEDNSGNLGIWSNLGEVDIYSGGGGTAQLTLKSGLPAAFGSGNGVDINSGGGLYVDGDSRVNGEFRLNKNYMAFSKDSGEVDLSIRNQGLTSYGSGNDPHLVWGAGDDFGIKHSTNQFYINGNTKTAIVPVDEKYKALYTVESPEVWFTDFAMVKKHPWWKFWEKDSYIVDKDFLKVTSQPYIFLPTLNKTIVLVYAKRKGFENVRFEEKTKEQFDKNNAFWSNSDRV